MMDNQVEKELKNLQSHLDRRQAMEEWLSASAGNSPCCEVCGDLPCRTMEVDGQTYEVIPEDLIVKAAIIAASRLIGPDAAAAPSSCCSTGCGCN